MNVIKGMSIFWILYGIAGLFGYQIIPSRFSGHSWTRAYIRSQGLAWILLGVPYFLLSFVLPSFFPDLVDSSGIVSILIIALGMPAFVYSLFADRKYKALLKKEQSNT